MGLFSEFIIDYNITYGEHEYSRQNKCGALANQIIRKKKIVFILLSNRLFTGSNESAILFLMRRSIHDVIKLL
jgi:hypothetical protein